jgi:hypothetical protein
MCQHYGGNEYTRTRHTSEAITVEYLWEKVVIDIQGPLRPTPLGSVYLLNIQDLFLKLSLSIPMGDTKTETIATAYINGWLPTHGSAKLLSRQLHKLQSKTTK